MEPTLRSGDLVLVNLASTQARDGAIYVLRHDDLLVAKRLQRVTDGSLYITRFSSF
jgi:phage repressor protein C with HTH and peptisase S24 domain